MALAPDRLARVNIDIPRAVSLAIGALPALGTLRAQMVTDLPNHPLQCVDKLEDYALAAWFAHILAIPPTSSASPIQPSRKLGRCARRW